MISPTWQSDDGRVHLYCGDCMAVLPTLNAESVDIIWTDPPYGHNNNNGDLIHNWESALGVRKSAAEEARPIYNDSMDDMKRVVDAALVAAAAQNPAHMQYLQPNSALIGQTVRTLKSACCIPGVTVTEERYVAL